jgi:site-specific DNA-cytosine methylase
LQGIHNDLESQGYEVQTFNISASSQGAWHKRARIWIVAANTNSRLSIRENEKIQSRGNAINNGSSADVPNAISSLRRRGGAELKGGENEIREFYSKEEEQARNDIRSKIIGCDAVLGETTIQHSNNQRCEKSNISKESNKQDIHSGEFDSTRTDKTWWQTQSELCGVPDGICYGLDKGRANRIKALGNSIVPQIIKEIGLAIYETEK